jgi:cytochrome P450
MGAPPRMPTASVLDTAGVVTDVIAPVLARGVIIRRPPVVRAAERIGADRRAVRRLQRLRHRHGRGPVLLAIPGRDVAVVLDPEDLRRVLQGSPEPFATANAEKRAALGHFQPHGVLISHGEARAQRRELNDEVLEGHHAVHSLGAVIVGKVREEARALLGAVTRTGELTWDDYIAAWFRMVRRVVLGDAAREDHAVTDLLADLRANANWSFLASRDEERRARFERQLLGHVHRAEEGSLAALVAAFPADAGVVPHQQIPQWLFAFDAAAWASFRALALISAHPEQAAAVREDLAGRDLDAPQELELLRATVLESLRLWPTTPVILRDTTEETTWDSGTLPAGTAVLIYAPFFHRDDERIDEANRFAPKLWLDGRAADDWPLVPFSAGPGECPGRQLVLLTTSVMLASLLEVHELRLAGDQLDGDEPLPSTLSPFHLRYTLRPV